MRAPTDSDAMPVMTVLDYYLLDIETGKSPAAQDTPAGDGEWGVLKVSAVQPGRFEALENKVVRDAANIHPSFEVKPGDLLMTRANTEALVGFACVVESTQQQLMLSDKTLRLHVNETVADPKFVALVLLQSAIRAQIRELATGTSAGMKNISQKSIRSLKVPKITLDQQRLLVESHAVFERRISALENSLEKLIAVRAGFVRGAMSGPLVRLGDLFSEKPRNGFSPPEVHEWTGLLTLGLGCLTPQGFIPRQLKLIPSTGQAKRFILSDGDLLMSRANTRELVGLVGRFRDVGQSCIYPDLMMRLRLDGDRCLPPYLEIVLGTSAIRKAVQGAARGTSESMVKISAGVVEALRIPLPALRVQKEIVAAVGALDARIAKQGAAVSKLRVIQQGVVEELLRGRRPELAA